MYISIHLDRTRYLYIYIYTSLNRYTSIHRYIHISAYGDIEICTYVSLYIERSTICIPGHAQAQAPTASSGSRFYGAAAPATPSASALLRPNVSLLRAPHSVHVRRARVRPRRHSSVRRALSPEGNEAETLSSAQTESPMQHNQTHTTSHTSTSTSTRAFVCFGLLLGFRERCVPTTMRRFQ